MLHERRKETRRLTEFFEVRIPRQSHRHLWMLTEMHFFVLIHLSSTAKCLCLKVRQTTQKNTRLNRPFELWFLPSLVRSTVTADSPELPTASTTTSKELAATPAMSCGGCYVQAGLANLNDPDDMTASTFRDLPSPPLTTFLAKT